MKSYRQYCGLALALDRVGERWTLLIVRELLIGPRRFSDLAAALPGVATNLLSARLRGLEADGLIERRQLPAPAPAAVYLLTTEGEALREPVLALIRFGGRYMLRRQRGQGFQPPWLLLSLSALCPPPAMAARRRLLLALHTPEGAVRLWLDRRGLHAAEPAAPPPEVTIRGPAPALLGLAAGAIDAALAEVALRFEGQPEPVGLVRAWLTRSALPSR